MVVIYRLISTKPQVLFQNIAAGRYEEIFESLILEVRKEELLMKKALVILGILIAAIVFLANLAPLIALAITIAITYFAYKGFIKAESQGAKIFWGIVGVIALISSISNLPALIGIAALYILYVLYKSWKKDDSDFTSKDDDPFKNFEKEWMELNKHY